MIQTIAQVVPLRRFPRTKGVFDYGLSGGLKIEIGDLVEVPFKNSLCLALVVAKRKKDDKYKNLKTIKRLIAPQFVNRYQLKIIDWLATYSGVSPATVAKLAVPFLPNRRFVVSPFVSKDKKQTSQEYKPVNIVTNSYNKKIKISKSLIAKVLKRRQQVLLLLPEIAQVRLWQEKLKNDYQCAIFTGSDKSNNSRDTWLRARSGQAQVIIGTRSALWLNFYNLGGIIVDQADNENFFQTEQNPRYDAIELAQVLSRSSGAALALISAAPRLENWQAARQGQQEWHDLRDQPIKIDVLDLKNTLRNKQAKVISQDLYLAIEDNITNGKQVMLYLNRRGTATSSICADCGFTAFCQRCRRKLVLNNNQELLTCYHCGTTSTLAIPCPNCGGLRLNYGGVGIDELQKEIKKLWPSKNVITVQDKYTDGLQNLAAKADIIIGSRTAWRASANLHFGLIALVNIDSEINLPEFRAVERIWQFVNNLITKADQLVIQTYQENHYLWHSLASKKIDYFYEAELAIRQKYSYPPFKQLIRLGIQGQTESASLEQSEDLKQQLLSLVPKEVEVVGPYPDYFHLKGKNWRHYILIKLPVGFNCTDLWSKLPEAVIIDHNPWFILS